MSQTRRWSPPRSPCLSRPRLRPPIAAIVVRSAAPGPGSAAAHGNGRIVPIAPGMLHAASARGDRIARSVPRAASGRIAIRSCARSTSRAARTAEVAVTASPIPIRRLPSWPRSRSSSRRTPRSHAEAREPPGATALGPAADRQMAVARTGSAHAVGGGCARHLWSRADQRSTGRCPEPRGAGRRCRYRCARPCRARSSGCGLCRAARFVRRCACIVRAGRTGFPGTGSAPAGGTENGCRPSHQARPARDRPPASG